MIKFPNLPKMVPGPMRGSRRTWELLDSLKHDRGIVPAGTITDGGSIPKLFQSIHNPTGEGLGAFIIHDDDYRRNPTGESRKGCDRAMRRNLKAEGVGLWKRWQIYWAVRTGGQESWNEYRGIEKPKPKTKPRKRR